MPRFISSDFIFAADNSFKTNKVLVIDDNDKIISFPDVNEIDPSKIEYFNGIITPGFFNSHNHLELAGVEINEVDNLQDFISQIKKYNKSVFDANSLFSLDKKMFDEGINFCGDISNNNFSFEIKKSSKIFYHTFLEIFSTNPELANSVFQNANFFLHELEEKNLSGSINLHSLYSISENLFEKYIAYISDKEQITTIHLMENFNEIYPLRFQSELIKAQKVKYIKEFSDFDLNISFLDLLFKIFSPSMKLIFVHCIYLDLNQAEILLKTFINSCICVCPSSNIFIEKKLISKDLLSKFKNRLLIGTDSRASNKNMSFVREMFLLQENSDLGMADILNAATFNASVFFEKTENLGTLEIGKSPGLVNIKNIDFENFKFTSRSEAQRIV